MLAKVKVRLKREGSYQRKRMTLVGEKEGSRRTDDWREWNKEEEWTIA